jgi:L1 cell adhesion molecule like protein
MPATTAKKGPVIGIDLGTTYSCVGVWQNDRVEIIASESGNRTVPSMVSFTDTERLIGDSAKGAAAQNPRATVFDAKRMIGREFNDPLLQSDMKHFPYDVINDGRGRPQIVVGTKDGQKKFYRTVKTLTQNPEDSLFSSLSILENFLILNLFD